MDDMDTTNDMKLYAKVHILLLVSISRARANTTYWFIVSTKSDSLVLLLTQWYTPNLQLYPL